VSAGAGSKRVSNRAPRRTAATSRIALLSVLWIATFAVLGVLIVPSWVPCPSGVPPQTPDPACVAAQAAATGGLWVLWPWAPMLVGPLVGVAWAAIGRFRSRQP
jgi:hypothetical protein